MPTIGDEFRINVSELTPFSRTVKLSTMVTSFHNPKTNATGELDVLCDIKVTRPDGSFSVEAKGVQCAAGKLQGDPRNVRLSSAVIKYIGEKGDPPGKWGVEIALTDKVRGTIIPLKVHFNLLSTKARHSSP